MADHQNNRHLTKICEFELIIKKTYIPIKFPCHFFIQIKSKDNKILITGNKISSTNTSQIQWNQTLKFTSQMDIDNILKKFIKKQVTLAVNLTSKSRPDQIKQVGRIKIDLSQIANQQKIINLTQKLTYCSLNANIQFSIKIVSENKDKQIEINNNTIPIQKFIGNTKSTTEQNKYSQDLQILPCSYKGLILSQSIKQIVNRVYQKDSNDLRKQLCSKQANLINLKSEQTLFSSFQNKQSIIVKKQLIPVINKNYEQIITQSTNEQNQKQKALQNYQQLIYTLQNTIQNLEQQISACHQIIKINQNLKNDLIEMQQIMKYKQQQINQFNQIVEDLKKQIRNYKNIQKQKELEQNKQNQNNKKRLQQLKFVIQRLQEEKAQYVQKNLMSQVEMFNLYKKIRTMQNELQQKKYALANMNTPIRQLSDHQWNQISELQQIQLAQQKRELQDEIQQIIEAKQQKVSELQQTLKVKQQHLKILAQTLAEKQTILQKQTIVLIQLESQISQLQIKLGESEEVKLSNLQLNNKLSSIASKQSELQQTIKILEEENKKINQIFEQKQLIDQQINQLRQLMKSQVYQIQNLRQKFKQSEKQKDQLEIKFTKKIQQIKQFYEIQINNKDNNIRQIQQKYKKQIQQLKKQKDSQNNNLDQSSVVEYPSTLQNLQYQDDNSAYNIIIHEQESIDDDDNNDNNEILQYNIVIHQQESIDDDNDEIPQYNIIVHQQESLDSDSQSQTYNIVVHQQESIDDDNSIHQDKDSIIQQKELQKLNNQQLNSKINQLILQLQQINNDYKKLNQILSHKQDQIDNLNRQYQASTKQISHLNDKIKQLNQMNQIKKIQLQIKDDQIHQIINKYQQQIHILKNNNNIIDNQLNSSQANYSQILDNIQDSVQNNNYNIVIHQQASIISQNSTILPNENDFKEHQINENLKQQINQLKLQLQQIKISYKSLNKLFSQKQDQIWNKQKNIQSLQQENQKINYQLNENRLKLQKGIQQIAQKKRKYEQELQSLKKQLIQKQNKENSPPQVFPSLLQNLQYQDQNSAYNIVIHQQPTVQDISIISYENQTLQKQNENMKNEIIFLNSQLQKINIDYKNLNELLFQRQDQISNLNRDLSAMNKLIEVIKQKQLHINDMQRFYINQIQNLQGHIHFLNNQLQNQHIKIVQQKQIIQSLPLPNNILQDVKNFKEFILANLKQMKLNININQLQTIKIFFQEIQQKIIKVLN